MQDYVASVCSFVCSSIKASVAFCTPRGLFKYIYSILLIRSRRSRAGWSVFCLSDRPINTRRVGGFFSLLFCQKHIWFPLQTDWRKTQSSKIKQAVLTSCFRFRRRAAYARCLIFINPLSSSSPYRQMCLFPFCEKHIGCFRPDRFMFGLSHLWKMCLAALSLKWWNTVMCLWERWLGGCFIIPPPPAVWKLLYWVCTACLCAAVVLRMKSEINLCRSLKG